MDRDHSDKTGDICRVLGKMSSKEVAIEVQGSNREDLIKTAVNFLNNPAVRRTPTVKKELFLKSKGLTDEEIKIAFERSNSEPVPYNHEVHLSYPMQNLVTPVSWLQKLRDILNTIALIFGATYGLYYLYKRFIATLFFGKPKKPKSIESSINDIGETVQKSIHDLKTDVKQVHIELEKVISSQIQQENNIKDIISLKSEIATVKGILLSRHQFPSVSLSTTSIPAWQLTGSGHKDDKEILENEEVEHNSGSSETEIVPNSNRNGGSQGSDSSLEMIKEVEVSASVYCKNAGLSFARPKVTCPSAKNQAFRLFTETIKATTDSISQSLIMKTRLHFY